jgi:hypothetical protein
VLIFFQANSVLAVTKFLGNEDGAQAATGGTDKKKLLWWVF